MEKKIAIIGCGWLGKPLAKKLQVDGNFVVVTTRSTKIEGLHSIHFDVEHFHELPDEIHYADVLIYSVPPLAWPLIDRFFSQLRKDQKIVFISSTSVYGKDDGSVSEMTELNVERGNAHLQITEGYLQERFKNLCIVRPGGLYGEKRHPVHFLAGKKELTTGDEFTHLVHAHDVINAVTTIVENNRWGEIFNLVSDLKMKKKDFYTMWAQKLGLAIPEYLDSKRLRPTIISNEKSKRVLGLNYHDPLTSLD
jgi:nucleoside-diphosphate-sugar epimerase